MIVSYKKLWKLLIDKDMTKTQLRIASGVSSSTMAKMTRGEDIQVSVLVRLCQTLKCDVGDIVQFIPDDECAFSHQCMKETQRTRIPARTDNMQAENIIAQNESSQPVTWRQFCTDVVATSVVATVGLSDSFVRASKAKPFVKWAGGKGQLISQLEALFPSDLATRDNLTYVEPFVGGGAMVFHMLGKYRNIRRVVINDFNSDLVCTYSVIRDSPDALIEVLSKFQTEYRECGSEEKRKEYYLQKRDVYNKRNATSVETAALFIFLNRTCFNGLYRVNSKGLYNVPFGRAANPLICDEETLRADSELLQDVEIINGDFEGVYDHIKGKAFVYFDPPYRPLPKTPSFTAYSKDGFNDEQQERLAEFCRKLDKDGHQWLLSNSDPANTVPDDKFFDEIYSGFDIQRVSASRMINSKADGRGKITELAIRNYQG